MQKEGNFIGKLKDTPNYTYIIDSDKILDELKLSDIASGKVKIKPTFIVKDGDNQAAISFWVSAKRTRSYPYTRIYETLSKKNCKKITIFPVVKDEGFDGDRDYIQWDTFSICSYLNVYTIPAYYVKAVKNSGYENKVTSLEFDPKFLVDKIKLILETKLSPSKWNDKERNDIGQLIDLIINGYKKIQKETGVKFHNHDNLKTNLEKMRDANSFKTNSQEKSSQAQDREKVTTQPKEELFGLPKGKVTLSDSCNGLYSWTVDAYYIHDNDVHLIEMKHSKNGIPSMADIKDALFKFHFYANIAEIKHDDSKLIPKPTLLISSATETTSEIKNDEGVKKVLDEATSNGIVVIVVGRETGRKEVMRQLSLL